MYSLLLAIIYNEIIISKLPRPLSPAYLIEIRLAYAPHCFYAQLHVAEHVDGLKLSSRQLKLLNAGSSLIYVHGCMLVTQFPQTRLNAVWRHISPHSSHQGVNSQLVMLCRYLGRSFGRQLRILISNALIMAFATRQKCALAWSHVSCLGRSSDMSPVPHFQIFSDDSKIRSFEGNLLNCQ